MAPPLLYTAQHYLGINIKRRQFGGQQERAYTLYEYIFIFIWMYLCVSDWIKHGVAVNGIRRNVHYTDTYSALIKLSSYLLSFIFISLLGRTRTGDATGCNPFADCSAAFIGRPKCGVNQRVDERVLIVLVRYCNRRQRMAFGHTIC